jgi:hypothetical protein
VSPLFRLHELLWMIAFALNALVCAKVPASKSGADAFLDV